MTLKRWQVTKRSNRGAYTSLKFFFKSKAERDASEYEADGLGTAKVSRV